MKPIFLPIILLISIASFSQEKNIFYENDTIFLVPPVEVKLVAFEINGVTIMGSYRELLETILRVKKSQFRDGKKKLNACITYMKKARRNQDTIHVTNLIEKDFDMGLAHLLLQKDE